MIKILKKVLNYIKEEYKFLIILLSIYIILNIPLNYYIIIGGGISDISSRVNVLEKYKSKGSFNISYVKELEANVMTYLLSFIIPTWEREDVSIFKYSKEESLDDILFRSDLDLKTANGNATYWAYTLANKSVKKTNSKLFVIAKINEYNTNLKVGDEILSIDNKTYQTVEEYKKYLNTKKTEVEIKIIRDNKEKTIKTKLYDYENKKILGVYLQYVHDYKVKPKVNISFRKSESGPSGGLITTLEIYNQLTKTDLTNKLIIAGTGTIEEDGSIGTIGGVKHKLLGADKKRADIFLVPSGNNYKQALKVKKKYNLKIKVVGVKNIEEAILKLKKDKR